VLKDAVPLDEAARQVRARILEFLRRGAPGSTLIITAPPGVGKTTEVVGAVMVLSGQLDKVWTLAPRHDLYSPELEAAGFAQIRGRTRDNCRYADVADWLGKRGHPVDALLCAKCELRRNCGYYDQFRAPGHRFATLSQVYTAYPQQAAVIVLDELTPADLLETRTVGLADLRGLIGDRYTHHFVRRLAEVLRDLLDRRVEEVREARRQRLRDRAARRRPGTREMPQALREEAPLVALDEEAGGSLRAIVDDAWSVQQHQESLDSLTVDAAEALSPPAMGALIDALRDELAWQDVGLGGGVVTLDPRRSQYRATRRRELPDWLHDKPLIILNATADPETLLDLLGRDQAQAEIYDPRVALPPEVEIVQLTDAMYGKTVLVGHLPRLWPFLRPCHCS
jgi:hypothetical protein